MIKEFKTDRESLLTKLEFMVRSIVMIHNMFSRTKPADQMTEIVSMLATAGAKTIHETRTPGVIQMTDIDGSRQICALIVQSMNDLFHRLHSETRGLPLPLVITRENLIIISFCNELTDKLIRIYEGKEEAPAMPPVDQLNATRGKINVYSCSNGHKTVTVDRVEGVTPFIILCPECQAEATSCMYQCDQKLVPAYEFWKPTADELFASQSELTPEEFLDDCERLVMAKIELGLMAKPLSVQLKEYSLDRKDLDLLQNDMEAVSRCYLRGYITESQIDGCYQRLLKKIQQVVRERKVANG